MQPVEAAEAEVAQRAAVAQERMQAHAAGSSGLRQGTRCHAHAAGHTEGAQAVGVAGTSGAHAHGIHARARAADRGWEGLAGGSRAHASIYSGGHDTHAHVGQGATCMQASAARGSRLHTHPCTTNNHSRDEVGADSSGSRVSISKLTRVFNVCSLGTASQEVDELATCARQGTRGQGWARQGPRGHRQHVNLHHAISRIKNNLIKMAEIKKPVEAEKKKRERRKRVRSFLERKRKNKIEDQGMRRKIAYKIR